MNALAPFTALLNAPAKLDDVQTLNLFLGRTIDEVYDWPERPDLMLDGLDRSQCHDAVEGRALKLCGDPILAMSIAELISTLIPLAETISEVDAAIDMSAQWMTSLMQDHLLTRIANAKREASDGALAGQDLDLSSKSGQKEASERIDAFEELESAGTLVLSLGGLDAILTVEASCILVLIQLEPGSDKFMVLYSFEHVDQGDDDSWDGGHDPDPEPEDGPKPLLAA